MIHPVPPADLLCVVQRRRGVPVRNDVDVLRREHPQGRRERPVEDGGRFVGWDQEGSVERSRFDVALLVILWPWGIILKDGQ